jgi:4'-phosphopantetheinyl transferase
MTHTRIDVLCCALTDIDSALLGDYENLLDVGEVQRLQNFRSSSSRKEFLAGRALIRTALAERLNCDPRASAFAKNDDGKPSLASPSSAWHFNLTHSHDWIALALCEGSAVGIDIESYRRRNDLAAIARRFFSEDENKQLAQCDASEWLDSFFAIWTLKEAHAKALGCGLAKILACSSIAVDLTAQTIDLQLHDIAYTAKKIGGWLYKIEPDFALALIAHGARFSEPRLFRCTPLRSQRAWNLAVRASKR